MTKLEKPPSIEDDPIKSQKWDEITRGRDFKESDVPTLALLCQWHKVAEKCIADLDDFGELIYQNEMRDVKAYPQLAIMKQASAEIRQLNKQLGINDQAKPEKKKQTTILTMVVNDRAKKAASA